MSAGSAHLHGDAAALAAIHRFAIRAIPRLTGVYPFAPRAGDAVTLVGSSLAGPGLVARFGAVETAVLVLSDSLAIAVVPPGGERGPVTLRRDRMESATVALSVGDPAPRVWRVDPAPDTVGVPRDMPVTLRLSHPVAHATVPALEIRDGQGLVPGDFRLSPDARLVAWWPRRLLAPGVLHHVRASGWRATDGRAFEPHASTFQPGGARLSDCVRDA